MPVVQIDMPTEDGLGRVRLTKPLVTPKRMSELRYWWRAIRKIFPQLPIDGLPDKNGHLWTNESDPIVTEQWIRRTLVSSAGERIYIVVNRKQSVAAV